MYDVVIIGSGVTGYGAGMYAGRLGLKTLIIGDTPGGTITLTDTVENYPGFKKLTGQELADNLKEHALDYKEFVEIKDARVSKIKKNKECFSVFVKDEEIKSKTVIFATGTKHRELKVPGHDEFKNKGVHYCALCDGFFYRGKTVAIVGGGDSAVKEALVLAEHAKKVFIIYRKGEVRAEPINLARMKKQPKIEIIHNTNISEIKGDETGVTSVVLDKEYKKSTELKLEGVFIAIGHIPLSDVAKDAGVKLNKKSEVIINKKSETNIPGDVVDTHFKQAITGVAEGVFAAYAAYEYINSKDIVCK